jgi:hypothetical protein
LCYGIFWYEQYNLYKTLINQLVASIAFIQMLGLPWTLLEFLIHMALGPTGSFFCSLEIVIMNVVTMQTFFVLNGIIICKYIFVFHLKNPLAVQEDFFAIFINLVALVFRCLRIRVKILPKKHPFVTEKSEAIACARRCRSSQLTGWRTKKE